MNLEYVLSHWGRVRAGLIETIDKFQEDELDFLPYPGSRSVKQMILHIAQEEHGEFAHGVVQSIQEFPAEYNPEEFSGKEAVKALLESVHAETVNHLQRLEDPALRETIHTPWGATYSLMEMIEHMIEHEVHHRAELSLILGMLGREGFNA